MISETIQAIKTTETQAAAIISEAEKQCAEILDSAERRANQILETQKNELKSKSEKDMEVTREKGAWILKDAMKAIDAEVALMKAGAEVKKESAVDLVITKLV